MSEHDRLGPPPIEPLSDVAWSRIERGLWSRMDAATSVIEPRRPRRWIWLAAPALAAAAAVLAFGGDGGRPAVEGTARLVSGAAPTTLSYGDVHVALDAESAVVMDRMKGAVLERGAAWFTVAPRGDRAAFVVTAGDTLVRVVGTKFRVTRSGEEAAVQVEHGTVEVQFRGATARVGAGEAWTSRQPTAVTAARVAESEIELAPAPAAVPDRSPGGRAPALTAPARPSSVDRNPAVRPDRPPSGTRTVPPTSARDADAATYHRLEQLEVRDPRAAIDGYLALSRQSPRWAEPALFAAARLSADRRESRARYLIEIYLTRFPSGANVDDARKLLDHYSSQGAHK